MYKTIIYDVDGTLLDGTEGILTSVKKTVNHFHLQKLQDKEMLQFVGPPIQNSCKKIFGLNNEQAQKFANYFRKEYASGDVFRANVYNGIFDLLTFLKDGGCKLGVATYKRQDYAVNLMKHFGFDKYFDSICGADNENKLKKFDILVNCMNELNANKPTSLLIGDSYHDAEAAQKLGIDFIGVTYGFGFKSENEVTNYHPILVADTPKQILEYFQKTNSKIGFI